MKGLIVKNEKINEKYYNLEIDCAKFALQAKVGQFLMIKPTLQDYVTDPLLRRPLGVADVQGTRFRLIYMVVGKGTKLLSECGAGNEIEFSKPLGNGFKLEKNKNIALAAGGIGIAPIFWLAKEMRSNGCKVTLFYGGRSVNDIVLSSELSNNCDELVITTNDGTLGTKGLVTEPMKEGLNSFDKVFACGPKPMMKAVSELAVSKDVACDVSLDERMACGLGACLGCLIYVKEGNETVQKRCCVEGPVFDGSTIIWD